MLRVLHSVSNMDRAGIETMLMNYYRNMDRSKIQFDFIVNKSKPGDYDEEIKEMGGRIYKSPGLNPIHYGKYMSFCKNIFKENPDIKILHAHNEAMGLYALEGAKKSGIKTRIAHAHNTQIIKDYKYPLKMLCKCFLTASATDLWGCGREAGKYFFGKDNWEQKGFIMRNAIDTEKFAYSEKIRADIRRKYKLENKTVLGHVGRFNMQKNHERLIDMFAEFLKINSNSVLVLIGEGELEDKIKEKTRNMNISDKVFFAGLQNNVNEWYMAMDLFLMPSLFEGLPVVGIEAQCSGLKCIFSEEITDEVVLSENAVRISLDENNTEWAKKIKMLTEKNNDRSTGKEIIKQSGYDIFTEAKRIENLYLSMSKR